MFTGNDVFYSIVGFAIFIITASILTGYLGSYATNKKDFPIASKMFEQSAIDDEYFENLTNQFRSPHIWYYEENSNTNQQWYLRNIIK